MRFELTTFSLGTSERRPEATHNSGLSHPSARYVRLFPAEPCVTLRARFTRSDVNHVKEVNNTLVVVAHPQAPNERSDRSRL
jgi:hypothetical protein